jgi:hypothetical protein
MQLPPGSGVTCPTGGQEPDAYIIRALEVLGFLLFLILQVMISAKVES